MPITGNVCRVAIFDLLIITSNKQISSPFALVDEYLRI